MSFNEAVLNYAILGNYIFARNKTNQAPGTVTINSKKAVYYGRTGTEANTGTFIGATENSNSFDSATAVSSIDSFVSTVVQMQSTVNVKAFFFTNIPITFYEGKTNYTIDLQYNAYPYPYVKFTNCVLIFDAKGKPTTNFYIVAGHFDFTSCSMILLNGATSTRIYWITTTILYDNTLYGGRITTISPLSPCYGNYIASEIVTFSDANGLKPMQIYGRLFCKNYRVYFVNDAILQLNPYVSEISDMYLPPRNYSKERFEVFVILCIAGIAYVFIQSSIFKSVLHRLYTYVKKI